MLTNRMSAPAPAAVIARTPPSPAAHEPAPPRTEDAPPPDAIPEDLHTLALHVDGKVHMVPLIRWPQGARDRSVHGTTRSPRILLVAPDAAPPVTTDRDEDWVRLPATRSELEARARSLLGAARPSTEPPLTWPVLDADGVLRHDGRLATVPPIEARILAALLHRAGRIVSRADLVRAGWPAGNGSDALLDSRVKHLRKRIRPLGLVLHTVRGTGLIVDTANDVSPPPTRP